MKEKKTKRMIVFGAAVLLGMMLLICFLLNKNKNEKEAENVHSLNGSVVTDSGNEESEKKNMAGENDENADHLEVSEEKDTIDDGNDQMGKDEQSVDAAEKNSFSQETGKNPQETVFENEKDQAVAVGEEKGVKYLEFPYEIQQSSLIIQRVWPYSGSYVEDGTNDPVSDITALLVTNTGKECIEFADITLTSEEGELEFSLSALEAGGSCILLESNRAAYKEENYLKCSAEIAFLDKMEMSETMVEVKEIKSGALSVKNVSDRKIPGIRVFYKYYDEKDGVYIGGTAFNSQITDLEAGYTKLVTPAHYAAGQSKVVMVRTYESDE